jgi:hypothetical protein
MCYECPEVKEYIIYWTGAVIGQEIKKQFDRLAQAGRAKLFAGVIVGWESNLAGGYCSLSHLRYGAQNPPADFDHQREQVLQRHIERWAKGIYDSGTPSDLIFTHLGPISKRDYDKLTATFPRSRIREIPQSTAFRAFWAGFNSYSSPGFSASPDDGTFEDILQPRRDYRCDLGDGQGTTIQACRRRGRAGETVGAGFNHGARIGFFSGFQVGSRVRTFDGSGEALTAYRKFLQGDHLVEGAR